MPFPHTKNWLKFILLFGLFPLTQFSCTKFLDEIPDKTLTVPQTLDDLERLLNNEVNVNGFPIAGEIAADNLYFTQSDWNSIFFEDDRNMYIWEPNTDLIRDWQFPYETISRANIILTEIDKISFPETMRQKYNDLKGGALFQRSLCFYELAQVFAPPYSSANASLPYGIPLRTSPDIDVKTVRSTVKETYDRIITDLKESCRLLSVNSPHPTLPSKIGAFALLSKTYMSMGDYVNAGNYADSSLQLYDNLMDYNDPFKAALTEELTFKQFNEEVIYFSFTRYLPEMFSIGNVNQAFFDQYDENDLRKMAFFKQLPDGSFQFKGGYTGWQNSVLFAGLATDEMFFNRAECKARAGDITGAMGDLNTILNKRWRAGTFVPFTAANSDEATALILRERRKELCFRSSIRWTDLRRLNLEGKYAVTITRELNGQVYSLLPSEKRYTFLLPEEIVLRTGIAQNPR